MESHGFRLPCERPDWNKISMLIGKLVDVRSVKDASEALLAITRQVHGAEVASTPHHLIEKFLIEGASKDEQCKIVQTVLPVLAKAAQSVNKFKLKESWQTYREINETGSLALTSTVSSEFLVSLMANCVLCTIPLAQQVTVHPLVSFLSSFERSRDVMYEKLRCVFKFFEDIGNGHSTCLGKVVFKLKVDALKRDKDPSQHVLKFKTTTEQTNKGMCVCPLLLPASLLLPPIGANDVIDISGIRDGVVVKGHALNLTIIEEPSSIGQEEQDSDYHDANDQSDVSVESDYETAPETNDNFMSPYELVSGYSNSLSKAITNCAIYDAVRTNKLRRSSEDSRSSQNSSNSSNQSNAREQAGFTEAGQLAHNLAQYYSQDTDRLHVNLLRRRSSNELSSHHSTSLSEFGSEMDEYFGKKISAINEDDSQHVEEFAATLACSVVSHGLNTASLLVPGIQQFEAKQPVNVAMRPIALRPTPESITPELSSDDTSSQVNSFEQLADNVVEQSLSLIFSSTNGKLNSAERVKTATANGFHCCGVKKKISYKKIEKLASNLVEKLINEVMLKKKTKINTEEACRQQIFNEKERASFVEAVDDLAGHVVELALQDAQDIINDRLDLDSFGSVNEEEYSIISSMSSMKESDSYEIIKIDSLSDASSSPVIVTKKSFSADECVDKILTDSFVELGNIKCGTRDKNDVHNSHFDVNTFSQMVIEAALQKLNELKSSNGSRRNLGDLGCVATSATICCDQSKVIGNGLELFRQNHKLELPEPTTNIVHDKVSEGNLISTQETIGRNVKYIKTKFDRNTQAFMSDTSENRLSGENSGPIPGTPPPTPDYLTKNNFENNQHALEEELRKRFAIEETEEERTKPKITSIDSLASKLASAAVCDGIYKETEGAGPKITSIDSLASKLASAAVCDGIYKETEGAGPKITSIDSLASKLASAAVSDGIHKVCRREKQPSSASTFTEDLLKIGNIDITGKRPSCTEENIAIFREELRRASIEQERELARRGSQLSDFADELESARFKEEIPNHIQEFAYDLANNILASAFRQQFGDIEKNNDSESTVDRQQPGAVSLDTAAQERNLLAMATNLANSIVASALQALRSQASGRSTSADRSPHSP